MSATCFVNECEGVTVACNLCDKHYRRFRKNGDPLKARLRVDGTPFQRWMARVFVGPVPEFRPELEACWLWTGSMYPNGYGQFNIDRHPIYAHRAALLLHGVELIDGLEVDHLCRVRHCVRPDHLEQVTHRENGLRGFGPAAENARKTHCPQGHPYDRVNSRGDRGCSQPHLTTCKAYEAGITPEREP